MRSMFAVIDRACSQAFGFDALPGRQELIQVHFIFKAATIYRRTYG